MITTLTSSLLRVTVFWYLLGAALLFIGPPGAAEAKYARMMLYPWVPEIEMNGIHTALQVQWALVMQWTVPMFMVWFFCIMVGLGIAEVSYRLKAALRDIRVRAKGSYWGVYVPDFSLGALPAANTPPLSGTPVTFDKSKKHAAYVEVTGDTAKVVSWLTAKEKALCEELLQMLASKPNHFCGLGHGVGLLEHTLNVAAEAAKSSTKDFRWPFIAALAHDVGKLVTFKKNEDGEWVRKGLHSRESARILASLPAFQQLSSVEQRALTLAIKYDHNPSKMPDLAGDGEASQLARRIIASLSKADKTATADEKDRHLEVLQPEDLLWHDFRAFLKDAPVVTRGKVGMANQINNPSASPYLFIYEAVWRDEAVMRMPPEVSAALDLTRRDVGKLAKYTRILLERLRKEGLLVEEYNDMQVTPENPLWDIKSGTGEKAVLIRGVIVLHADRLWKSLNYRLGTKSPFPVTIVSPNSDALTKAAMPTAKELEEAAAIEASGAVKVSAETKNAIEALLTDGAPKASFGRRNKFKAVPAPVVDPALPAVLDKVLKPAKKDDLLGSLGPQEPMPGFVEHDAMQMLASVMSTINESSDFNMVLHHGVDQATPEGVEPDGEISPKKTTAADDAPASIVGLSDEPKVDEVKKAHQAEPVHPVDTEAMLRQMQETMPTPAELEASIPVQTKAKVAQVITEKKAPVRPKGFGRPSALKAATAKKPSSAGPQVAAQPAANREPPTPAVASRSEPSAASKQEVQKPEESNSARNQQSALTDEAKEQPAVEKQTSPADSQDQPNVMSLSWSERTSGIDIATAEIVAKYSHLTVGDRFYSEKADDVIKGRVPVGTKYGDTPKNTKTSRNVVYSKNLRRKGF